MDITFNDKVETQLRELKKYQKNSLEWEMKYYDLYNLIYYRVVSFCKSNSIKIQNEQNLRVDIDEYCSVALSEVLIKLVDDFDPYTDKGFMNLYYYRIKKAFINCMGYTKKKVKPTDLYMPKDKQESNDRVKVIDKNKKAELESELLSIFKIND